MDQNEMGQVNETRQNMPAARKEKSFGRGVFVGVIVTVLLIAAGWFIYHIVALNSTDLFSKAVQKKLETLEGLLDTYYYEDIEDADKIEGIYKGLVESADDQYTVYYTAEEYEDFLVDTTSTLSGIGATLQKDSATGYVLINKVYEGSPAENAGLRKGDLIISADGMKAADYDLDEFVDFVRGEEGTSVELVYMRDEEESTVSITREQITIPTVTYQMLEDGIAYIEITSFASNTEEEFDAAIEDLTSQGMKAIIFDLRANGGGMVDAATGILDSILPEGTTVYMVDKNGNRTDYTSDGEQYMDYPITVLTSAYTASASEIFTGAIRDFHYGTIIGTKTFGKGIVQVTIPLSDGSALKVTTQTYYTPSGDAIHGKGIEPDVELEYEFLGTEDDEYSVDLDNQVQKAIEVLREELEEE